MIKLKKLVKLKENSFEGGVAGFAGTSNYSTGYGTFGGGNTTQNPDKFSSSDKTVSHFASDTTGSAVPKMPDRPDVTGNTVVSPAAAADTLKSQKPLNPEHEYDSKVDQLFVGKKHTPSPDEVLVGMEYEMGKMVKKDKAIAKIEVLKNLKNDPHYYSRLNMLNIDDDKMKVDENSTFYKTKSVLDEMIADKKKSSHIGNSEEINQIFKELTDRRMNFRKIKR